MRIKLCIFAVTMCLALAGQAQQGSASGRNSEATVTPTSGESWLNHLHRSFGDTSMGKTGRLGPPPPAEGVTPGWQLGMLPASPQSVQLRGADLYRLNCQGCHGEKGEGAPPEINSVINPVRATSVQLVLERMKKVGMDMSSTAAGELAKQAQDALVLRLHSGGQSMPPFPQLTEAERRALIAYLKQLAGVPGVGQLTVTESPMRVGELIVKSTCHTCHDATGANPTPVELENGAIPPLETLPTRVNQLDLIRKVTSGAPIAMGTPPTLHRGRMPVFYYLTREEAADVYLYLTAYPPTSHPPPQSASSPPAVAGGQQEGTADGASPAPPAAPAFSGAFIPQRGMSAESAGIPDWAVTLGLLGVGSLVLALTIGGLGYVAYELTRLGRNGSDQTTQSIAISRAEQETRDLIAR
jgi:mono/diheme cytochrome c family protein